VASVDEFEDASRVVVDVGGREIAVFRTDDGFHALSNYCVHQGGPACEGAITGTLAVDEDGDLVYDREGEIVSCPWHGWEFDVTNGEHLADPSFRLPTYEVELDDGEVYVR
jgi:nitrite reductase/ring-hydroxylating ferredoxin subunit